jgi:hypothetical protein
MEQLHQSGGVPPGWKFALPGGDPVKGRQVFADLECFKCHALQGETFPAPGGDAKNVGPELTGMGGQHPAEYFAESILTPNAVIVDGPGFVGPDGQSLMPSYADSLSVTYTRGRRRPRRSTTTRCGSTIAVGATTPDTRGTPVTAPWPRRAVT